MTEAAFDRRFCSHEIGAFDHHDAKRSFDAPCTRNRSLPRIVGAVSAR